MSLRRIAIATNGRFHVLDLARELCSLGHEVRFYSWVPRHRAMAFGLPEAAHVNLLPRLAPVAAWARYLPNVLPDLRERLAVPALNSAIVDAMVPCDDFIGMSGITLESARHAKAKFGARIWIERGSQHIQAQQNILAALPGAQLPTDQQIARELESYAIADRITVPSQHVVRSFACDEAARAKLFVNPYGVSIERFPQRTASPQAGCPTVLMVGSWSLQKGVDYLTETILAMEGVRLLHVGGLVDAPFPDHPRFEHHGPVDQSRLPSFYARGHVFVLASRQDGFGLVLSQALSSGLPIVCSEDSGGPDLKQVPELADRIMIFPTGDSLALRSALATMLERAHAGDFPPLSDAARSTLSWRSYARRYSEALLQT